MESAPSPQKLKFFERLSHFLIREPEDRAQLLELLHSAHQRQLIDADALAITEGAFAASETRVADIMVPRAQMDVIDINDPIDQIVRFAIKTAHSRFPVIDGNRDQIIGILLAKDLLHLLHAPSSTNFNVRDWLRPAVFIPESKRLNVLLREFRVSHNHMAIVIDEYSGVSGLVSIEDVLEQIVGEIEDEFDFDEALDNIRQDAFGLYRVKAQTKLKDFNAKLHTNFAEAGFDTVGGLVLHHLGHVPKRNECVTIHGVQFHVLRADSRRVYTLVVNPNP